MDLNKFQSEGVNIYIDSETISGPEEEFIQEFLDNFKLSEMPEEGKLTKAQKSFLDMPGVKNSAEIILITVRVNGINICLSCMKNDLTQEAMMLKTCEIEGFSIDHDLVFDDEKGMLIGLHDLCDELGPINIAYSWNGPGFDYAKIRLRCGRYDIDPPHFVRYQTETKLFDVQKYYSYNCTSYKITGYYALKRACNDLDLDSGKMGCGSEVQGMYETGRYGELKPYGMKDAILLEQIAQRLRV